MSNEKRVRVVAEARLLNVPTPSTRYVEALARLKTEIAESKGRVRRLTVKLANEKKKKPVPASRNPGARPTRAAMNDLTAERDAVTAESDSLVAERDRLRSLVDTRGTHVAQLSEDGAVTEELGQTRRSDAFREDQWTHQCQLTH